MKEIPLTHGYAALVDDEDYERLMQRKWFYQKGYAKRFETIPANERTGNAKQKLVSLHRVITNAPAGTEVDHRNGNRLDCRKDNLRIATPAQNRQNRAKQKNGQSSKYKGVSWCKAMHKWVVQICANHVRMRIGYFTSEEGAARAYDEAAVKYFGEFARTNF